MPTIQDASIKITNFPNKFASPFGNDDIVPLYSSVPLKSPVEGCLDCVVCGSSITRYQIISNESGLSAGGGSRRYNGSGDGGGGGVVITPFPTPQYPPKPPIPPDPPYPPIDFCASSTQAATFTWVETLNTEYTFCTSVKSGERSFTNPLGVPAYLYLCGSVDDDILINNQVMEPGCCIFTCDLNGAHNFSIVYQVEANETTYIGVNNNFTDLSSINVSLYYLPV